MRPDVVCPTDHLPLEVGDGALVCAEKHRWEIASDIPRLVDSQSNYADAFGLQWNVYEKTQLDSHTGLPLSLDRARRCMGEACWEQLQDDRPTDVLEVGCGAGRFTEPLLATRGARVTSIDFSSAVEANQANCLQDDRHRILQANVLSLPFEPGRFDVVFCLGVIQHTPNPEETIRKLYEQVKPGGWLVVDHYAYNIENLTKFGYLLRPLFKRLPPEVGLRWTDRLVKLLFPLHRAVKGMRPLQMVLSRVSPVLSYFHTFPELDDRLQYKWALLDTHDALTDWHKHLRTRGQIERTLRDLGAVDVACWSGGNGVEASCRRGDR